jgi:tetratricopeptide (TPR) repeat protein
MFDFDTAIKLNSKSLSVYHNRGMALSGKGRHEKAVDEFSKVIEMNQSSPILYKDRGTAYRKLGEIRTCIKGLRKGSRVGQEVCGRLCVARSFIMPWRPILQFTILSWPCAWVKKPSNSRGVTALTCWQNGKALPELRKQSLAGAAPDLSQAYGNFPEA